MIQLPNGCYCSEPKVNPSNWDNARVSCKKDWYIYYRFYDPLFKENPKYKKGKLVIVKGMNAFARAIERQEACRQIIRLETNKLLTQGFNPITGQFAAPIETQYEIDPVTPILEALQLSFERLTWEYHTKEDIKSVLKYFSEATVQVKYDQLPISEVRRKHIKVILSQAGQNKGGWSATNFNKYRGYLMSLFKELVGLEAIDINPVADIERMKGLRKIREVLNPDDRRRVVDHLSANYPEFHRFVQIFFHSGARRTELLKLRVRDVNIQDQCYKVLVKKGRANREWMKPIKNIALPYWKDAVAGGRPEDYVFSVGLKPGTTSIRPDQVTRRWEEHVKKKLGITADLYSLKHLNTTEVVDALDEQAAAKMNSHTSTAMVVGVYDVRSIDRKRDVLRKISNTL
jgi:integrase